MTAWAGSLRLGAAPEAARVLSIGRSALNRKTQASHLGIHAIKCLLISRFLCRLALSLGLVLLDQLVHLHRHVLRCLLFRLLKLSLLRPLRSHARLVQLLIRVVTLLNAFFGAQCAARLGRGLLDLRRC